MTIQEWIKDKPLSQPILCPVDILIPVDYNPRTINPDALDALKKSISSDPGFMKLRPILINTHEGRAGNVYAGDKRLVACKELNMTEVYVMLDDVTEEVELSRNIKDNHHQGEWVQSQLAVNLAKLRDMKIDMDSVGFTPVEMSNHINLSIADPKNDPENNGAPRKKGPKLKIAEGAELECPNCHSKFSYGVKADMTGSE